MMDTSTVYVATSGTAAARHVSLIPYIDDLEAICGQRVQATNEASWSELASLVTCNACRLLARPISRGVRRATVNVVHT